MILACLGIVVHGIALWNPFYFDDIFVLRNNGWIDHLQAPGFWFKSYFIDSNQIFAGYRPLLMLTFWLNAFVFGKTAGSFRFVNIGLHITNAILLFHLVRTLPYSKEKNGIAGAAAFLFLLHPTQTLPINLLWKRSELLVTTFILMGLILHSKEKQRSRYRVFIIVAEFLLFALALFTKESALVFPALLLALDFTLLPLGLYIGLAIEAVSFYFFRFIWVEGWMAKRFLFVPHRHSWDHVTYFLTSLECIPRYFALLVLPNPRIVDDPSPVITFPWQGLALTFFLLLLSLLIAIRFWRQKIIPFSIALIWISIGPTTGFMPVYFVMDQIRLYLPIAGLSILLSYFLFTYSRRHIFLLAILSAYGIHSYLIHRRYSYPVLTWVDVVAIYPQSNVGWAELGVALADTDNYPKAIQAFDQASRIEPSNLNYKILAAQNRLRAGESKESILSWLSTQPTKNLATPDAANLAHLASMAGDYERTRTIMIEALWLNPNFEPGYVELGTALTGLGRYDKARRAFERALELLPNDPLARMGLERLSKMNSTTN